MQWRTIASTYQISSSGHMIRVNDTDGTYHYLLPTKAAMYTYHINGKPTCKAINTLLKEVFEEGEYTPVTQKDAIQIRAFVKKQKARTKKPEVQLKVFHEALGPEEPLRPMRKCHNKNCKNMTYNFWCDECRPVPDEEDEMWGHPDDWYNIGSYTM